MSQPTVVTRSALPSDLALANVKSYLRVYDTEHDATITLLIQAAVEFVQTYTRQTFQNTQFLQVFRENPVTFKRFPVISIDEIEQTVADSYVAVDESEYEPSDDVPPQLLGPTINLPIRITWTAGFTDWPKDLILLIWQIVEENFDRRGTTPGTAQAMQFSRAHQLALEQYCTHHDAVR